MNNESFLKQDYNIFGVNSSFDGDLSLSGETFIYCTINGSISIKDKETLTLEKTAHVNGSINGHDIEIFGSFEGNIYASGTVCCRSSSQVSGKIVANNLAIYPGAQVNLDASSGDDTSETA